MSAIPKPSITSRPERLELFNGDRMTQEEFHAAYEQTPPGFRAELIEGIVYVASPLKRRHGFPHLAVGAAFFAYIAATPGVEGGDNTTVILGEDAEPQPDLYLCIKPTHGGQSRVSADDYVKGAPELIAEIAYSSRSIDLHRKRNDYARNGVREYLVVCIEDSEIRWFDLERKTEPAIEADKIVRPRLFPGLWIDAAALFSRDDAQLLATVQRGIASAEHADFVARLAAAKKP